MSGLDNCDLRLASLLFLFWAKAVNEGDVEVAQRAQAKLRELGFQAVLVPRREVENGKDTDRR